MAGRSRRNAAPVGARELRRQFGAELRDLRTASGLTLTAVAGRVQYSKQWLNKVEHGGIRLSGRVVQGIVVACGGDPDAWGRRWDRFEAELTAVEDAESQVRAKVRDTLMARRRHFVARGEELAVLRQVVAHPGSPVALVVGEPGIGKTALLTELAVDQLRVGRGVLWGTCRPDVAGYEPFLEALDPLLSSWPDGPDQQHLAARLGDGVARPTTLPGDGARYELFRAIVDRLRTHAEGNVVLVVDDLHAVEASTALLFRYLAEHPDLPDLRLVAAARSFEGRRNDAFRQLLAELHRGRGVRELPLGGLAPDDLAELVPHLGPDTVAQVHRASAGNPFLALQCARFVDASDVADVGTAGPAGAGELAVPAAVHDTVVPRVEALGPDARVVLQAAAVVGETFDFTVLEGITDVDRDRLASVLDTALLAGLLERRGTGYAFAHTLVRDALYADVGPARRGLLHQRVADTLEGLGRTDDPGLLIHHLRLAPGTDDRKLISYTIAAGDRAIEALAYEEAVDRYDDAVRRLDDLDDREGTDPLPSASVRLAQAFALLATYDTSRARRAFLDAADHARRHDLVNELADAGLGLAYLPRFGEVDAALVAGLDEALQHLPAAEAGRRAQAKAALAGALYWGGDRPRVAALCTEARAGAMGRDDATRGFVLAATTLAQLGPDNLDQRRADATQVLGLADGLQWPEMAMEALDWRAGAALEQGDMASATADYAELSQRADRLRLPWYLATARQREAMVALLRGGLERAEALITGALDRVQDAPNLVLAQAGQLFQLRRDQGRLAELEGALGALAGTGSGSEVWLVALAILHYEQGDATSARAVLSDLAGAAGAGTEAERAVGAGPGARAGSGGETGAGVGAESSTRLARLDRDWMWLAMMAHAAEVAAGLGELALAEEIQRLLSPYEGHVVVVGLGVFATGAVERPLGLLAGALGDHDRAVAHLRAALTINQRLGARPWVARTQLDLAQQLGRGGAPARVGHEVRHLHRSALATADQLGMTALRARIRHVDPFAG